METRRFVCPDCGSERDHTAHKKTDRLFECRSCKADFIYDYRRKELWRYETGEVVDNSCFKEVEE